MNINEIQKGDMLYKMALELRYRLFFKEHDLPKDILNDDKEDKSTHMAISDKGALIAYARLTPLRDKEFQISQMLVSPQYQQLGYGETLLRAIMQTAKDNGAETIRLEARTTATRLYEKSGFQPVGQVYSSQNTGVAHIRMIYNIKNNEDFSLADK